MFKIKFLLFLFWILLANVSFCQSKAYVLQNSWSNNLNAYTPKEFLDEVFEMLKTRLSVTDIIKNPMSLKDDNTEENWKEMIRNNINEKTHRPDSAYYIALSSDLALPLINLTKIIFKKPTRTSRFIFQVNVYNNKGNKILSDTIASRGCVSLPIHDDKIKNFYPDYTSFTRDMRCHLSAIRERIQKK